MALLARITLGLLTTAIILLAIILGGIRLVLVNIEYFKPEIEYLITDELAPQVVFSSVSGSMNRFNPVLRIHNVSINLPDRSQPLFIDKLDVEFDFWTSLRKQTVIVLEITSQLDRLELTRDESGKWWADRFELSFDPDQPPTGSLAQSLSLLPRYLKIDLRRLIIKDQLHGVTHRLDRVAAHINHRKDQFFVQLGVSLPEKLGSDVVIKSVLGKDQSLVYLNASSLKLKPILDLLGLDSGNMIEGSLDGELWANLQDHELVALSGDLTLKDGKFQLDAENPPISIDYHSRFSAALQSSKWRVANNIEHLLIEDTNWGQIRTQFDLEGTADDPHLSIWADRVNLSGLPALARQFTSIDLSKMLERSQLQGEAQNLLISHNFSKPENFLFGANVQKVQTRSTDRLPGVTNLDAEIVSGRSKVGIYLQGEQVSLDFGDLFRTPIELDQISFNAVVNQHEFGTSIAVDDIKGSNKDIDLDGRMWLETDQYERPFMYLRANFQNAEAGSAARYLPTPLMPKATVAWIDNGIKKGFSPRGDLQFHGRLRDVAELESSRSGEFFVDFDIQDAEVLFSPDWLPAKNGEGRIIFHNMGVDIDLKRVSYENLDHGQAGISIANFKDPVLALRIDTESAIADAVRIWIDSPVGEKFRDPVSNLHDLKGTVKTAINLNLPLSHQAEPQVRVLIDLENGQANSRNWGLNLSQVNGRVNVLNSDISGQKISARYFGDPVNVEIKTDTKSQHTVVNASGLIESRNLVNLLSENFKKRVKGKSNWQIRLAIANNNTSVEQPFLTLNAASNLKNTQLGLPVPFAKPAESVERLNVDIEFFPQQMRISTRLGSEIRARARLATTDKSSEVKIEALDIAFATELRSASPDGLYLYGFIPTISVGDWIAYLSEVEGGGPNLLQSAELKFGNVIAFGHDLNDVDFELEQDDDRYFGQIDSSLVSGNFQIPNQGSSKNPINIDLEYLRIDKQEQKQDDESEFSEFRPSNLPDFHLTSQSLVFHDSLFNDLVVEARVAEETLFIDKLEMRRDQVNMSADAKWRYLVDSDQHESSFSAKIKGKQFGQAIAGLGFGDSIRGGKIDLETDLLWTARLHEIDWDNLEGNAKLKLTDGVLNNVEPGSGRFVGLLSLSAIPRRLSLDFSDVLIKGLDFDKISGTYRLSKGVLYTTNTRMDGPAAKIKISGKTGIEARDYDQTILVTPKIRQTLPVIGAVAASSAVGWSLLLLQNLFKKVIDKAVEVEYKVSGSWDDPKIELTKAVDENEVELPENRK
jgi:uncharacterized protein (TIGR02099 family)